MLDIPQKGDDVLQTDIDQTKAINENDTKIVEHDSKIMQLLNWMGLVKDYVIETGSNSNGRWEKWHSGKLVQEGIQERPITYGSAFASGTMSYYTIDKVTYPIPFIEPPNYKKEYIGAGQVYVDAGYQTNGTSSHGPTNRCLGTSNNFIGNVPIYFEAVGRWK